MIVPWVLCMSLKFEFPASKELSMCDVILKLFTCWKDLNMAHHRYFSVTVVYLRSSSWLNSACRVSEARLEGKKFEVAFPAGIFLSISSMIDFLCVVVSEWFSSSAESAIEIHLRNGVSLLRRLISESKSSWGKKDKKSHSAGEVNKRILFKS